MTFKLLCKETDYELFFRSHLRRNHCIKIQKMRDNTKTYGILLRRILVQGASVSI